MAEIPGTLVLAATPIGRVEDASPRLARELAEADVVAAEDTRRLRRLTSELGVTIGGRVVSYFEGNEAQRTPALLEELEAGHRVLLVTDAGMPSVSDPGYRLVVAAVAAEVPVTAVPGPSAVLTALAVSGLPVDRFCFEGFLPRKQGERARRLAALAGEERTMVFFEAPHRTEAALAAMAAAWGGERAAAVCRELTKTHEEVRRGPLGDLVAWAADGVRGEVTIVVSGATPGAGVPTDDESLRAAVAEREAEGMSRKEAIVEVARAAGVPKRHVYAVVHLGGARLMTRLLRYRHDGLTFDVDDEGPIDGDPVVLLHGFPERNTCWRDVAPLLHAHGLRTYAPDQRGYSPGARPPRRRDYTMDKLEADVVALIEDIGRPVHLVGHDWGANSGWLVSAHHPELVRTWTAVSVPHPAAFRKAMFSTRQAFSSWYMGAFQAPRVPERLAARPGGRFDQGLRNGGMTREEVERFRREVVAYGALPGALNWYRAMPFTHQRDLADTVTVPTTMLWGDGDVAVKRQSIDRCADHVTGPYELRVLEGASHWMPTQAPQAVADAVLSRIGSAV